ncbi:hypothetical protein PI124_g8927 [Phytophthora idaei]|nr:hypothetical protein PI125_g8770 [Phytophthora idaei]KAG3158054.1 hypothetical protein PI126_g8015 [Phytophthora idaei]KAG3246359.1 hypothetical protein PI124_g8927 [Phytophthora idaei]
MDEKHPVSTGFIVRRLKVWNDKSGESRVIQHIQLTTWPDHAWRRYKLSQVLIDITGAGEAMKQALGIYRGSSTACDRSDLAWYKPRCRNSIK